MGKEMRKWRGRFIKLIMATTAVGKWVMNEPVRRKNGTRKKRLSKDCVKPRKSGIAEDGNEIKLGNKGACDKKCLWDQGDLF